MLERDTTSTAPLLCRAFSIVDPATSDPFTRGQNQKVTVLADVEDICAENEIIYCPASSNTKRDAGVPLVTPSDMPAVYVSG